MLSEDEIINQFRKHGMTRGAGSLYLKVPIAFDFLATCQENNLAIIGVEGFLYTEKTNKIMPVMDYIADYSDVEAANWEEYRNSCNRLCKDFLGRLPSRDDFVVNFVLFSREEWEHYEPIEIAV
jgi:hypothetical protein